MANMITENMHAQCEDKGNQFNLMKCILDHKTDAHAVDRADMCINHVINTQVHNTTRGWQLCVKWKYETKIWERLSDLSESKPVEVSEYVVSKNLHDSPAFVLWVPYVLKKYSHIIASVTNIYHKGTHTFGIEAPKSLEECVRLDE
jgi:hypothetical protein